MKTKLLNNLPFKIISVIAAIVLWLIVVNIDDTVETDVFKNLPGNPDQYRYTDFPGSDLPD